VSDMLGQIDYRRQSTSFRLHNRAHTMTLLIAEVRDAAVVPQPATLLLLGSTCAGVGLASRHHRQMAGVPLLRYDSLGDVMHARFEINCRLGTHPAEYADPLHDRESTLSSRDIPLPGDRGERSRGAVGPRRQRA
jgi:hypothetical protein